MQRMKNKHRQYEKQVIDCSYIYSMIDIEMVSGEKTGKRLVKMIACDVFYLNYAN